MRPGLKNISILAVGAVWAASSAQAGKEDLSMFRNDHVARSSHFVVHHEDLFVPAGLLNTLETIHAKLLLDLGVFSPWAYHEPIRVYLFKDKESFGRNTGALPYSAAYVRLEEKTIYARPGDDLSHVLAHELGHLFFSQYFLSKSTMPPLWLNEGVASLMETQYGFEKNAEDTDRRLALQGTIPFDQFLTFSYEHASPDDGESVGLWYAQAESVTRFLMRNFSQPQFLRFCDRLRNGGSVDDALSNGYGSQMPNAAALESLWIKKIGGGQK